MDKETQEYVDAIYEFCDGLGRIYGLLLRRPLRARARRARLGIVHAQSARFVSTTADVLGEGGELFSDVPVGADELASLQARADALRHLRRHLVQLVVLCGDTYLELQGRAVGRAVSVLRRVRQDAGTLFLDPLARVQREVAMAKAEALAPGPEKQRGRG